MAVTEKATRRALLKLLSVIAGPAYQKVDETEPCDRLIEHVIELTKTEASEGAALIEACAPHGKSMLTHAQQTGNTFRVQGSLSISQRAIQRYLINCLKPVQPIIQQLTTSTHPSDLSLECITTSMITGERLGVGHQFPALRTEFIHQLHQAHLLWVVS